MTCKLFKAHFHTDCLKRIAVTMSSQKCIYLYLDNEQLISLLMAYIHSLSHCHECTNIHTHQLLLNLMCADGVAEPQVTNTQSDVLVSSNENARLELSSADRWFITWCCGSTRTLARDCAGAATTQNTVSQNSYDGNSSAGFSLVRVQVRKTQTHCKLVVSYM